MARGGSRSGQARGATGPTVRRPARTGGRLLPARLPRGPARSLPARPAEDPSAPHVLSWPENLEKYYPQAAKVSGREGLVRIAITLDAAARVIGTQVLEEEPSVLGFAEAAEQVARDMQYSNPTGRTAQLKIFVRFALQEGGKWTPPVNAPSGAQLGG